MSGIISDNADLHSGLVKTPSANFEMQVVAGDLGSPSTGDIWYNSVSKTFRCRNNASTITITTS